MNTICYIVAMRAEATPFIREFGLKPNENFFAPLPCQLYEGEVNGTRLCVVLNGAQHDSDLVGCEAATLATSQAIQRLRTDLIINSGTCGAFESKGADIARVYIGNGVMFHDRRVPGDDAWATQSIGNYPVWKGSHALALQLGLPEGKVTTGSSLDMQPCDLEVIQQHGGELKDMEGAAIAFVCSLYGVPVLFVKSVTDLVDHSADTFEVFSRNLAAAGESLRQVNKQIISLLTRQNPATNNPE